MAAFIYTRVSTKEQVSGVSLEVQEQECRAWCTSNGYEAEVFTDAGWSGKRIDRPQLQEMLGRLPGRQVSNGQSTLELDWLARRQGAGNQRDRRGQNEGETFHIY